MALLAKLPIALENRINQLVENATDAQLDTIITGLNADERIGPPNQELLVNQVKNNLIKFIQNVYEFRKYSITGVKRKEFTITDGLNPNGYNLNDFVFAINTLCKALDLLFNTNIRIYPQDYEDDTARGFVNRRIAYITQSLSDHINDANINNINIPFIVQKNNDVLSFRRIGTTPPAKNEKIITFIDPLIQLYYEFILPFYNKYYLNNTPIIISSIIPNPSRPGAIQTILKDFKQEIYNIYYSLTTLIKVIARQTPDIQNISRLTPLIVPQPDHSDRIPIPATDQLKIAAIEHYNSLTGIYNKYIGPYKSKYPGLEDNADIMYTRSHFYPAIEAMYKSLPTVGFFGPITRKRATSRPRQGGGLRYGRRKKNGGL